MHILNQPFVLGIISARPFGVQQLSPGNRQSSHYRECQVKKNMKMFSTQKCYVHLVYISLYIYVRLALKKHMIQYIINKHLAINARDSTLHHMFIPDHRFARCNLSSYIHSGFSEMEVPHFIIHFNGILAYKPSFWVTPINGNPHIDIYHFILYIFFWSPLYPIKIRSKPMMFPLS